MKRLIKANENKPSDSIKTYRNNRNANKYIEVKEGDDGHHYMRQYMEWDSEGGHVKNYTGSKTNRGRYSRARKSTIDQALEDYTEVVSSDDLDQEYVYTAPEGPKDDAEFDSAAERIARLLEHRKLQQVTTEDVIEAFRTLSDRYDDYWGRGLRTPKQEKEFVDKLLASLAKCGITDVVDNTFDDVRSSQNITASSLVKSGCSFDFTWEDDYDMQEIESAVYEAFDSQGLEVTGTDFYSADYSQHPEYDDRIVSQCGVDFISDGEYDTEALQEAIETEMLSRGYEVVGCDFYSMNDSEVSKVQSSSDILSYQEVLSTIERAFMLKENNLPRYRKMIQDINSTAGVDADEIFRLFAYNNSIYECENTFDMMDTACRDKVVEYSKKWSE